MAFLCRTLFTLLAVLWHTTHSVAQPHADPAMPSTAAPPPQPQYPYYYAAPPPTAQPQMRPVQRHEPSPFDAADNESKVLHKAGYAMGGATGAYVGATAPASAVGGASVGGMLVGGLYGLMMHRIRSGRPATAPPTIYGTNPTASGDSNFWIILTFLIMVCLAVLVGALCCSTLRGIKNDSLEVPKFRRDMAEMKENARREAAREHIRDQRTMQQRV